MPTTLMSTTDNDNTVQIKTNLISNYFDSVFGKFILTIIPLAFFGLLSWQMIQTTRNAADIIAMNGKFDTFVATINTKIDLNQQNVKETLSLIQAGQNENSENQRILLSAMGEIRGQLNAEAVDIERRFQTEQQMEVQHYQDHREYRTK